MADQLDGALESMIEAMADVANELADNAVIDALAPLGESQPEAAEKVEA